MVEEAGSLVEDSTAAGLSGRYDILGLLGSGSSADVYRVRDRATGGERALKLLRAADEASVLAFRREFLLLSRLRHPGLVDVGDFETLPDGRCHFTAAVVSGRSLAGVAPLSPEAARAVLVALAGVLGHLHRAGVVHGDLKPENVILADDGSTKLLDLGMAMDAGTGRGGGTPAYMAPEVACGAPIDPRADRYALGAVGYFLVAGRPPHAGATAAEAIQDALRGVPRPLPDAVGPDLARAIMALLAKDPAARPPLAAVLAMLGAAPGPEDGLPARALPAPLVGREHLLAELARRLDAALGARRLAVLSLAGPAGVGKDRLADELRTRRQAEGMRFAAARCAPGGDNYHALDEALRALGITERPPWSGERSAHGSRGALWAAVASFFSRLGRSGPVAIHLADWHAADAATRDVVAHLARVRPPGAVVLILSCRDVGAEALQVGPLPEGAVAAAATAMLGGAPVAPALAAELHAMSEGNPLFLMEILDRALAQGLLEPAAEGLRARQPLAAAALPASLADALAGRLAGHTDEARAVARALAAIGHPAPAGILSRAAGLAGDAFAAALDELEHAGLAAVREGKVAFSRGAMAEAVASRLAPPERAALSERIVAAIEDAIPPGDRETDVALLDDLARHALEVDPAGRGVRYGLAAARAHMAVYAIDRARAYLEAGLGHIPAVPAGSGLEPAYLELLADAHRHGGAFGAARERYEDLASRLGEGDPRLARTWSSLGLCCQSLADYDQAMRHFERSLAAARRDGDTLQALRALTSIARLAYLEGRMDLAARAGREAVGAARAAGEEAWLAEALALTGYLAVVQDPAAETAGLADLEEALAIRRRRGDPVALADSLMFLGNAQSIAGRPLDALRTFGQNLDLCRETGAAAEDAVTALLNVSLARLEVGAWTEAAASAREAGAAARVAGNRDLIAYAGAIAAVAASQAGELARGLGELADARQEAEALESPYLEAAVLAIGAEALLAAGAALDAREQLGRAARLAAAAGTREFDARIAALLADACLALGDLDRAGAASADLARAAGLPAAGANLARAAGLPAADADLARAAASPVASAGGVRWLLACADQELRLGPPAAAAELYGRALEAAERLGMAQCAGRASLGRGLARLRLGESEDGRADLLAAQRMAAQLAWAHLQIDSLLALAATTGDPAEAGRYRDMANGMLGPVLSGLSPARQAGYLGAGGRDAALRGHVAAPAGVPAPGATALPVGALVARLLEANPDPTEVLARTLAAARERFGAQRCLAVLRDGDGWDVRAMIPESEELVRFSRTFIDMALAEDRTLWTLDALADPRLAATASVAALELRAIACTPVRASGQAAGALYLDWDSASGGLTDEGRREFEALAGIAGVCLAQAGLLEGLARRTERLEMASELAAALARALSVDDLMEMALRHSLAISGAQTGCVLAGPDLAVHLARDREGRDVPGARVSNAVRERLVSSRAAFALVDAQIESLSASVAAEGLRSVLAVPIHVSGELRGAIYLSSGVSVRGFGKRDLASLEAVANQVAVALGRVDLERELARRERMRRELEIARDVQRALLPKRLPAGDGFDLAAASLPAFEVGGDFYDALRLPDGSVGLLIGDVAGKGVPAALLMATLLAGFRAVAPAEPDPGKVLARLNDLLIAHRTSAGVFASAFYAVYDPARRRLSWACAGHERPLARPVDLAAAGPVLGLLPGLTWDVGERFLPAGTVVVTYTDGIEDARGPGQPAWGREDLAGCLADRDPDSAQAAVDALLDLVGREADHYDDITVLALMVR